jgi:hypothetical protein
LDGSLKTVGEMPGMDVGNVSSKDFIYIKGSSTTGSNLVLKSGEMLQARVVSSSQGNVILRIGDARIVASSNIAFEPGAIVSLMVSDVAANRIVLKQVGNQNSIRLSPEYSKDDILNRFLEMAGIEPDKAGDAIRAASNMLKGSKVDLGKVISDLLDKSANLSPAAQSVAAQSSNTGSLGGASASGTLAPGAQTSGTLTSGALASGVPVSRLSELIISSSDSSKILEGIKLLVGSLQHESEQVALLNLLLENAAGGTGQSAGLSSNNLSSDNLKMLLLAARSALDSQAKSTLESGAATVTSSATASGKELIGLIESIDKVLQSLNAAGIANIPNPSVSTNQESFFYLPLPIRCGDNIGTADIRIYKDGNDSKNSKCENGGSMITVGFALEMPALGSTKALLEVKDNSINLFMAIGNEEAVRFAADTRDGLVDSLESLGYKVGAVSVMHLAENDSRNPGNDIAHFGGSLIEAKMGTSFEGVDIYG